MPEAALPRSLLAPRTPSRASLNAPETALLSRTAAKRLAIATANSSMELALLTSSSPLAQTSAAAAMPSWTPLKKLPRLRATLPSASPASLAPSVWRNSFVARRPEEPTLTMAPPLPTVASLATLSSFDPSADCKSSSRRSSFSLRTASASVRSSSASAVERPARGGGGVRPSAMARCASATSRRSRSWSRCRSPSWVMLMASLSCSWRLSMSSQLKALAASAESSFGMEEAAKDSLSMTTSLVSMSLASCSLIDSRSTRSDVSMPMSSAFLLQAFSSCRSTTNSCSSARMRSSSTRRFSSRVRKARFSLISAVIESRSSRSALPRASSTRISSARRSRRLPTAASRIASACSLRSSAARSVDDRSSAATRLL
mmetsp:Transcript_13301/g.39562  ORF Transcript_13301/g.39562 Transcript_13301/m.39562 type:complete len:373 (-) Transcript_13301:388-1506(-)